MRRWTFFLLLSVLWLVACSEAKTPATAGFLQGDRAFVPQKNRVLVLDVAAPDQPEFLAEIMVPGDVIKVIANGRFLYIAHSTPATVWNSEAGPPDAGLRIVDVSDPRQPALHGFVPSQSLPTDLVVHGNLAYLADWEKIAVIDVSDSQSPSLVTSLPQAANGLDVAGSQLAASWGGCSFRTGYCVGGIVLYDLTDPRRPSQTNEFTAAELPGYDVALVNGQAFVTGKGVWTVDLANEASGAVNGRYELQNGYLFPAKIVVHGSTAYSLQEDGLHLLDVGQPAAPVLLGQYTTTNYLTDLTLRDGLAYLTGWNGLEIVDVTNPATPRLVGSYFFDSPIPAMPQPSATPAGNSG